MDSLLQDSTTDDPLVYHNPADFIEAHMVIPETRQPLTLHPEQRRVLTAMNERDTQDNFRHSLWLYAAPKKSAKTTVMAGVALWQAWRIPNGEIYIIGNDQKQADNRMTQAIRFAIMHNPAMSNRAHITKSSYKIELDNGTRIEAIPVDPRGEAGMNPTGLFWTEAWGAVGDRAEMMWSEATLSPTHAGQAIKGVESYAGYSGESLILERLYNAIVNEGEPDPEIPELYRSGSSIAYWCTRRYLEWQTNAAAQAYYAQQALEKTPAEFRRQHKNEWVSSEDVFVPGEWWDACRTELPPMRQYASIVVGVDAGISNDSFAIVAVWRVDAERVAVRYVREWKPPRGGKIEFMGADSPESELRRLAKDYNVSEFTYDPTQLHSLMTLLQNDGVGAFREFSQGLPRLIADKQLYDMIRDRRILHDGDPVLAEHIKNANRKLEGENEKMRIIKRAEHLKIDCSVALSMAVASCMELNW